MNNLAALPESLSRLSSLTYLDVADNRLQAVPVGLCQLPALAALGLRSNCLTELPADVGSLAACLTHLDLGMNQLRVRGVWVGWLVVWVGWCRGLLSEGDVHLAVPPPL